VQDSLEQFYENFQLSTKSKKSTKASNIERSVEKYSIKVIKILLQGKEINNKKISYNIENEGLIQLRKQLKSFISENKTELLKLITKFKDIKSHKDQKTFLFQSETFKNAYIMIIELMFHPRKAKELGIDDLAGLHDIFKLNCCEIFHDISCLEKWKCLKLALMNKTRKI
jgi:hypothetical protein